MEHKWPSRQVVANRSSLITVTMCSTQQSNHGMHGPIRRHLLESPQAGNDTAAVTLSPIRSGDAGLSAAPSERLASIQKILSRDDGVAKGDLLVLLGFKIAKD